MVGGDIPSSRSKVGSMAAGERPAVPATKVVKIAGLVGRLAHPSKKEQVKYEICSLSTRDEETFKYGLGNIVFKYTKMNAHESVLWIDDHFKPFK